MRIGKPFTSAEMAEATGMWARGETVRAIAAKLRRPKGTVGRLMWEDAVNFPPRRARGSAKQAESVEPVEAPPAPEPRTAKIRTVTRLGVSLPAMSWETDAP